MNLPKAVSRDEWHAARQALLVKEKAATRACDTLNTERRSLPMVKVEKEYAFQGPNSSVSLHDLFDGRQQLIVCQFMFDPSWNAGCTGCSYAGRSNDRPQGWLRRRDEYEQESVS